MQADFADHRLGETQGSIEIETREDNRRAALAMASNARSSLDVLTRSLDHMVYDNRDFLNSVRELAIYNRRAQIRFMVHDVQPLISHGHGLVRLARRLSTFITLRTPAKEHTHHNCAFLVADQTGVIYNPLADRYEGTVSFNNPPWARDLITLFDEMWETGAPDPNLRRLHL